MQYYSDIPVPEKRTGRPKSRFHGVVANMTQGHSVFFEPDNRQTVETLLAKIRTSLYRAVSGDLQFKGCKYVVRQSVHPDTGLPCVGLWRVD